MESIRRKARLVWRRFGLLLHRRFRYLASLQPTQNSKEAQGWPARTASEEMLNKAGREARSALLAVSVKPNAVALGVKRRYRLATRMLEKCETLL